MTQQVLFAGCAPRPLPVEEPEPEAPAPPERRLRRVVCVEFVQMPYTKRGWGQNLLTLECGHTRWQKTSVAVPRACRCRACTQAQGTL